MNGMGPPKYFKQTSATKHRYSYDGGKTAIFAEFTVD
jgi:hypothetical protein